MCDEIWDLAAKAKNPIRFNMGEMLDSLALDHISSLTSRLVPLFSRLSNGYLMLLTKSSNIDGLLSLTPNGQTVVSWSLNTQPMIDSFEVGTASLEERLHAAKRCQERGYRIRLRIDPGILYPDWQRDYAELICKSLAVLEPENITLGMRGCCRDISDSPDKPTAPVAHSSRTRASGKEHRTANIAIVPSNA